MAKPQATPKRAARDTWCRFVVTEAEDRLIRTGHAAAQRRDPRGPDYRLATYLRDVVLRAAAEHAGSKGA